MFHSGNPIESTYDMSANGRNEYQLNIAPEWANCERINEPSKTTVTARILRAAAPPPGMSFMPKHKSGRKCRIVSIIHVCSRHTRQRKAEPGSKFISHQQTPHAGNQQRTGERKKKTPKQTRQYYVIDHQCYHYEKLRQWVWLWSTLISSGN